MALILKRAGHLRLRLDSTKVNGVTADDVVTITIYPVGGEPARVGLTAEEALVLSQSLERAGRG